MSLTSKALSLLFPKGPAWGRRSSLGRAALEAGVAAALDEALVSPSRQMMLDVFPQTTTMISEYDEAFDLPILPSESEDTRRARLASFWGIIANGAPVIGDMQTILQNGGFPARVRGVASAETAQSLLDFVGHSVFDRIGARRSADGVRRDNADGTGKAFLLTDGVQISSNAADLEFLSSEPEWWEALLVVEDLNGGYLQAPGAKDWFFEIMHKIKPAHFWVVCRVTF